MHKLFTLHRFWSLAFLISSFQTISAQQSQKIPLQTVLQAIEKKQNVKFFYKHEWIKEIQVDESAKDLPLQDFISSQLNTNGIGVLDYYDSKYIILFKGTPPVPSLISTTHPDSIRETSTANPNGNLYILEGIIKDGISDEKIIGATIYSETDDKGTTTNHEGYYKIKLPYGAHQIRITAVGKIAAVQTVNVNEDQRMDVALFEQVTELNDVVITSQRVDANVTGSQMSQINLDVKAIRKIPQFMGEIDVIRSIMTLPGVSTVGEGASGFNVRGGNVDQNLILLDEVPLFNSSHLFGFFSTFNPDFVKDVTLLKGGMPANYGGRIASVLDVKLKDGNTEKLSGTGGLGIIASRLMLDGPIGKKTTFAIGGRYAYPNWILKQVPDINVQRSSSNFYDVNFRIRHQINDKNNIYFSAYRSEDQFKFAADTTYGWSTTNASLRWNSVLMDNLFANITGIYSKYQNQVDGTKSKQEFQADFGIDTRGGKIDLTYIPNHQHHIDFGVSYTNYIFNPGKLTPPTGSLVNPITLNDEYSIETGYYISDEFKVSDVVSMHGGIRFSQYSVRGRGDVFVYEKDVPRSPSTVTEVLHFANGQEIKNYSGWEPRFSVKFSLTTNSSVKVSYNRNLQYLQLISNTAAVSPLDLWKTSNYNIRPQTGNQFALGYFKNFADNAFEFSAEAYYKRVENVLEYKDGANLFMNPYLESQLLNATGEAYGLELLLRKKAGKLTGWVAYTYARSFRVVKGNTPEETINFGNKYPSNFDKPNDVSIVANYAFTRRISLSANFTYSTGRPFTNPKSVYLIDGYAVAQFAERNQARIPDYHRLDLSFTIEESLKRTKKWKGSWTFSIYNAYGRVNPYSVFFKPQYNGYQIQSYQLSVIGTIFPAVTYNLKF